MVDASACVCAPARARSMAFVAVVRIVACNRASKKSDGCEKADKRSSKRERERELFLYFFHLFALDADVCAAPLCIRVYARTNQAGKSTCQQHIILYMCLSRGRALVDAVSTHVLDRVLTG